VAAISVAALAVGACSTGGIATRNVATVEQVQPLPSSEVASANLPAIGESGVVTPNQMPDGTVATAEIGTPVGGTVSTGQQTVLGGASTVDTMQTASADGSFVTLDAVGAVPQAPGRDLSGGLTIEKLLGGWTIVSGADQCKLNLTYTSKSGTSRYRASTPGCQLQGLKVVARLLAAGREPGAAL
jgi:hypothetical protein